MNIGARPTLDDLGVGGTDPFGNSLSEARETSPTANLAVDGAFKAPGLRNVELTAPYFHNGGMLTLRQVLDFYGRRGDFQIPNGPGNTFLGLFAINFGDDPSTPQIDVDPVRAEQEKQDLVEFLKALTDERVRYQKAPFDHPELFVPNGHPGNQLSVTNDGTGKATDSLLHIPAVGHKGGMPLKKFLEP